jgi:hypothetical protein
MTVVENRVVPRTGSLDAGQPGRSVPALAHRLPIDQDAGVLADQCIGREEDEVVGESLADEHAIEGVFVDQRKRDDPQDLGLGQWQRIDPVECALGRDELFGRDLE